MKVIKDNIFDRQKALSPVHLFHICTNEFVEYLVDRLVSLANGDLQDYVMKKFKISKKHLSLELVESDKTSGLYIVYNNSSKNTYTVDVNDGLCTCSIGMTGAVYKHAAFIHNTDDQVCGHPLAAPVNEAERKKLFFIATGRSENIPEGWFADLNIGHSVPITNVMIDDVASSEQPTMATTVPVNNDLSAHEPSTNNDEPDNEKFNQLIHNFQTGSVNKLVEQARTSSRIQEALSTMIANYTKCTTEDSIVSACSTFDKYSGLQKKKSLTSCQRIQVGPKSIACRKSSLAIRKCIKSGKPRKLAFTQQHGYYKINDIRRKAPHSITWKFTKNVR